jgi:hypothetical protein
VGFWEGRGGWLACLATALRIVKTRGAGEPVRSATLRRVQSWGRWLVQRLLGDAERNQAVR